MATLKIATEDDAYLIGGQGTPVNGKCIIKSRLSDFNCRLKSTSPEYNDNQLVAYDHIEQNQTGIKSIEVSCNMGHTMGYTGSSKGVYRILFIKVIDSNDQVLLNTDNISDIYQFFEVSDLAGLSQYIGCTYTADSEYRVDGIIYGTSVAGGTPFKLDTESFAPAPSDYEHLIVRKTTYGIFNTCTISASYMGVSDSLVFTFEDDRQVITNRYTYGVVAINGSVSDNTDISLQYRITMSSNIISESVDTKMQLYYEFNPDNDNACYVRLHLGNDSSSYVDDASLGTTNTIYDSLTLSLNQTKTSTGTGHFEDSNYQLVSGKFVYSVKINNDILVIGYGHSTTDTVSKFVSYSDVSPYSKTYNEYTLETLSE